MFTLLIFTEVFKGKGSVCALLTVDVCFNRSKQNHYHLKSTFQATSFLVAPTGLCRSKQSLFIYMFYTELFFEAVEEFYVSTYAYS